jgi:hypothetical protein
MTHDLPFNDKFVALDPRRNVYLWRLIDTASYASDRVLLGTWSQPFPVVNLREARQAP